MSKLVFTSVQVQQIFKPPNPNEDIIIIYVAASGTSRVPVVCIYWKNEGNKIMCGVKRVDKPMYTAVSKGSFHNECLIICSC